VDLQEGNLPDARLRIGKAFVLEQASGRKPPLAQSLVHITGLAVALGMPVAALRMAGAAIALCRLWNCGLLRLDEHALDAFVAAARQQIGVEDANAAWQEDEAMAPDEAMQLARSILGLSDGES
jgi:hypothetical protein